MTRARPICFAEEKVAIQGKKLVLWMCAAVVASLLLLDGLLRVIELRLMTAQFERFGYGLGALKAFGAAELLAGVLLLVPAVRMAGATLGLLLMALAVFAYVSTGVGYPVAPAVVTALLLALVWMHLEQRLPSAPKP